MEDLVPRDCLRLMICTNADGWLAKPIAFGLAGIFVVYHWLGSSVGRSMSHVVYAGGPAVSSYFTIFFCLPPL